MQDHFFSCPRNKVAQSYRTDAPVLRYRSIDSGLSREREQNVETARKRTDRKHYPMRCNRSVDNRVHSRGLISQGCLSLFLSFLSFSSSRSSSTACSGRGRIQGCVSRVPLIHNAPRTMAGHRDAGESYGNHDFRRERKANRGEPDLEAPSFRHRRSIPRVPNLYYVAKTIVLCK